MLGTEFIYGFGRRSERVPVVENKFEIVKFEVFTAVTMKNTVFWDVAPCRYCVNRRFGGTYLLPLQGRKIRKRGPA
jgi:hypothetical protein